MHVHNLVADSQADSGTAYTGASFIKFLLYQRKFILRDALSIIPNSDHHIFIFVVDAGVNPLSIAAVFTGIVQNIQKHLAKPFGITGDFGDIFVIFQVAKLNSLFFQAASIHEDGIFELCPDIRLLHGQRHPAVLHPGKIQQLHDHFRYTLNGTARLAVSQREPERPMTVFRFPSDYTQPWQGLTELLEKWDLPANPQERAWQLMTLVHEHMEYAPGTTGVNTTAEQAFASGKGVCQDYAHIYLAMARQAGLTARYVNGLPEGEGVSHAWCEVWLDGIWTGIDPTRCQWTDDGYIRFGVGRDFGDCPIERGVFRGGVNQTQTIFMRVWEQ